MHLFKDSIYYKYINYWVETESTYSEEVQKNFGNLFFIIPLGKNEEKFPKHQHKFHILSPSPWPICMAMSILILISGFLDFLTGEYDWVFNLCVGFIEVFICVGFWWKDVVAESLTQHTKEIKRGIAIGMVLFIISEVMFFFSFFWAFFHVSLSPSIELGCVWPPKGLELLVISPFGAPLLNTVILLSSGITITCAHHAFLVYCYKQRKFHRFTNIITIFVLLQSLLVSLKLKNIFSKRNNERTNVTKKKVTLLNLAGVYYEYFSKKLEEYYKKKQKLIYNDYVLNTCLKYYLYTIILAVFFTFSQGLEYLESAISISDGVYGSTFFVMTGFHGFHVIVGTIFLIVCFLRILCNQYSFVHFIGLECAIWYWHFVDVVWLFLYLFVYYWGNAFIPIIDLSIIDNCSIYVNADSAREWQLDFQDSASVLMESIVDLHNYIMFYLWLILGIVTWLLLSFTVFNPESKVKLIFYMFYIMFFDLKNREKQGRFFFLLYAETYMSEMHRIQKKLINKFSKNIQYFRKIHEESMKVKETKEIKETNKSINLKNQFDFLEKIKEKSNKKK